MRSVLVLFAVCLLIQINPAVAEVHRCLLSNVNKPNHFAKEILSIEFEQDVANRKTAIFAPSIAVPGPGAAPGKSAIKGLTIELFGRPLSKGTLDKKVGDFKFSELADLLTVFRSRADGKYIAPNGVFLDVHLAYAIKGPGNSLLLGDVGLGHYTSESGETIPLNNTISISPGTYKRAKKVELTIHYCWYHYR